MILVLAYLSCFYSQKGLALCGKSDISSRLNLLKSINGECVLRNVFGMILCVILIAQAAFASNDELFNKLQEKEQHCHALMQDNNIEAIACIDEWLAIEQQIREPPQEEKDPITVIAPSTEVANEVVLPANPGVIGVLKTYGSASIGWFKKLFRN